MSPSTSYLQTVTKPEAIAFIASLQKVKDHLSQELEWMTEQVQQKTTQLQGIETLLVEATELGLVNVNPDLRATVNGLDSVTPVDVGAIASDPNHHAAARDLKPEKKAKQSAAIQPNAAKAKKPKGASKSTETSRPSSGLVDLRKLLTTEFQGQTFTDSVAQILERTTQPLHVSELLDQLYADLSDSDYNRARISLAKVLSTGKSEGKWQALGKGMYTGKTGATA